MGDDIELRLDVYAHLLSYYLLPNSLSASPR